MRRCLDDIDAKQTSGKVSNPAKGGDVGDYFTSLGAEDITLPPEFATLKENLAAGIKNFSESWERLIKSLENGIQEIQDKQHNIIPQIQYEAVVTNNGFFPNASEIRKRGAVVVKNVIPNNEVVAFEEELKEYLRKNPNYSGYPAEKPQIYEIYWSKPQVKARQHERMLTVMNALNGLWHASENIDVDLSKSALYIDRLRIRDAGDATLALAPHVDGGSVERWEDTDYRKVYSKILEGNWEDYDAFNADFRVSAKMDLHHSPNQCTFFRSFQGWLSLSHTGPGLGTLQVFPLLKESTAFLLLRPFLDDVRLNDFCGATLGKGHDVNAKFHGIIYNNMVSIPQVVPGDAVVWHCDCIHAVEAYHGGSEDGTVFYIPSGPDCLINRKYKEKMRKTFLSGETPPDFPKNDYELEFHDRAGTADLNEIGKRFIMDS